MDAKSAQKIVTAALNDATTLDALPMPNLFPAEKEDFVRLVIRAKTPADGMKRFREFLKGYVQRLHYGSDPEPTRSNGETPSEFHERREIYREKEQRRQHDLEQIGAEEIQRRIQETVERQLAKYDRDGIGQMHWESLAKEYACWWQSQRSEKARKSAKQKKHKKSLARKKLSR